MPKIMFKHKAQLLGELWLDYRTEIQGKKDWEEFFDWADIALPLSFMISKGYADKATEQGVSMIENTWKVFCEMLGIDPEVDFRSVAGCFANDPNKVF
jgi:hypothetical protein